MIINTTKLAEQINMLDDKLFPNTNWDTCSMSFLEQREAVAIRYKKLISEIENMAGHFANHFGPSFDMEKVVAVIRTGIDEAKKRPHC